MTSLEDRSSEAKAILCGADGKNDAVLQSTSTADAGGGGSDDGGADADSSKVNKLDPTLVANGTSNDTMNDCDRATNCTVMMPGRIEGRSIVVVEEEGATDIMEVGEPLLVQGDSSQIGRRDRSVDAKIKSAATSTTTLQSEVDVEMISTEMVDGSSKAANNKSQKSNSKTAEVVGHLSRSTNPSKSDSDKQPLKDEDDDEDEHTIPPHFKNQQTIVEKSPAERYIRFKEKLGSGAYKDVYRAYDTIEGIEVAWNVVKLGGVPKAERVRIVNEVRLLERLHHPNIISFHGSWVNRETERVIFVTEILSSGTLKSFVQKVQLIRWKIFKRWTIQILKGLEYLHSQDPPIIHRDLKCDNIFINGTSGDLRIGDFGLSTAISNRNQRMSVLGTPEFMAPELYDENYNEKVDIYAFGLLLLEIITRDVPYNECANPAQIYKKVTQGIPPASLRRVKSEDARNFILFCLGIGKDASERPSASELLKHPFLEKKPDDETTIEVEPTVEDMIIDEGLPDTSSDSGSERSKGKSEVVATSAISKLSPITRATTVCSSSIDSHAIPTKGSVESAELSSTRDEITASSDSAPPSKDASKPAENDEHTDDHYGGMPQNEAKMKKVTVLMGRGTALDDEDPPRTGTPESQNIPLLYNVSAVPKEDFVEGTEPYPNDLINLALTLPDESRTTIEFDFHLVNDDPVQVAREMVTELEEVPDCAVLDISGAISKVAREARMMQSQWKKMQQQSAMAQQGMMMHNQGSMMPPQGIQVQPQVQPQGLMMPQQQMYNSGYPSGSYPTNSALHQMGLMQTPIGCNEPLVPPPPLQQSQMPVLSQQQQQQQHIHMNPKPPSPPPMSSSTPDLVAQLNPPAISAIPQHHQQPLHAHQQVPPQPLQPISSQSSMSALPNQTSHLAIPMQHQIQQGTPMGQTLTPLPLSTQDSSIPMSQIQNALHEFSSVVQQHQSEPVPPPMIHHEPSSENASISASTVDVSDRPLSDGYNPSEDLDLDVSIEVDAEEMRKLEQEFEKKLQRAKKSYGTRMDNLHRSKEEAEAQHQMTLEKHEKERIEFEKRVRLAEEEQARRLSQLEKEFIEKKKEFLKAGSGGGAAVATPPSTNNIGEKPPLLPSGHKRSNSHVLIPKPSADHKRIVSDSDVDESQKVRERSDSLSKGQVPLQPHKAPPRTELPPTFPRERNGSKVKEY